MLKIKLSSHVWPTRGEFCLSRGGRTEVTTLQMEISDGTHTGKSEAVPYARYGENITSVMEQITPLIAALESGLTRNELLTCLPAGAARNLCDLALWDLEAKTKGQPVWQLADLPKPQPHITAYTLSLASPEKMAIAARQASAYPLLKLKLGTNDDKDRLKAIKQARPDAHLIVDANEGWSIKALHDLAPFMHEYGVVLCEQPLPVTEDSELKGLRFPFRLCADESIHTSSDIPGLCDRYQVINIKLDKTGGLTEALETIKIARHHNLEIMVGCMLASSLALAPAALIASLADWIDLDGPLLLAQDYEPRLDYEGAQLLPPSPQLWG